MLGRVGPVIVALLFAVVRPPRYNVDEKWKGGHMSILAEIMIIPVGTGTASISRMVADSVKVIQQHGLKYEITATGTNVEGDLDTILKTVKAIEEVPFKEGADRVVLMLRIDDRRDKEISLEYEARSARDKL